jgi:hypothetical protein
MTVYRNVPVAALLIAPVAAKRMGELITSEPQLSRRESRTVAGVASVAIVVGLVVAFAVSLVPAPLSRAHPAEIARALGRAPGEHRVVNAYNASGLLLALGGPHVRLAVDGRSDRVSPDDRRRYFAMIELGPGWRQSFARLSPTDVVLRDSAPLVVQLLQSGWHPNVRDHGYVWLTHP